MVYSEYAIALNLLLFLTFFYFFTYIQKHTPSDRELYWYRLCRYFFINKQSYWIFKIVPNWLFGVAWFIIYWCSAIAGFLAILNVQAHMNTQRQKDLFVSAISLLFFNRILNLYWTEFFFKSKQYLFCLILSALMFASVISSIVIFYVIGEEWSASLLIPNAVWLIVAMILNYYFVVDKKEVNDLWNKWVIVKSDTSLLRIRDEVSENKCFANYIIDQVCPNSRQLPKKSSSKINYDISDVRLRSNLFE